MTLKQLSAAVLNYQQLKPDSPSDYLKLAQFRWQFSRSICVDEKDDQWRCEEFPDSYVSGDSPILRIKYLGVWDTVGSLGVPAELNLARLVNHKYRFHDADLSTFVSSARHAVAIDEKRKSFAPTLWGNIKEMNAALGFQHGDPKAPYQEMWFPGTHGSVGGGGSLRELSDEPLNWIWRGAIEAGLVLDSSPDAVTFSVSPNYLAPLDNVNPDKKKSLMSKALSLLPKANRLPGPRLLQEVSLSARFRWAEDADSLPEGKYRPQTLGRVSAALDEWEREQYSAIETKHLPDAPEQKGSAENELVPDEIHVVEPGDTLGAIATRYYGKSYYYMPLFKFNRPPLMKPDEIYPGQEIKLAPKTYLDSIINWEDVDDE